MDSPLYTYRQLARRFGVSPVCISGIVKARGIPAARHPVNWKAKAIDADGYRQIEEALLGAREPASAAS